MRKTVLFLSILLSATSCQAQITPSEDGELFFDFGDNLTDEQTLLAGDFLFSRVDTSWIEIYDEEFPISCFQNERGDTLLEIWDYTYNEPMIRMITTNK